MKHWQDIQQSIRNCSMCQREEGAVFAPFPFFNETLCLTIYSIQNDKRPVNIGQCKKFLNAP